MYFRDSVCGLPEFDHINICVRLHINLVCCVSVCLSDKKRRKNPWSASMSLIVVRIVRITVAHLRPISEMTKNEKSSYEEKVSNGVEFISSLSVKSTSSCKHVAIIEHQMTGFPRESTSDDVLSRRRLCRTINRDWITGKYWFKKTAILA